MDELPGVFWFGRDDAGFEPALDFDTFILFECVTREDAYKVTKKVTIAQYVQSTIIGLHSGGFIGVNVSKSLCV